MQTVEKEKYRIETFEDILNALRQRPDWLEELRRIILTEELIDLPQKFETFLKKDFKPLKTKVDKIEEDVAILKQDVTVLKQDVAILKQDVASLKGSDFERTVRERAPAYFGRLIRRCRIIGFETLSDKLEDAVDIGLIGEDEKYDALLLDAIVSGKLKTGKDVILAVEVSLKVDIEDIQRAAKRADVVNRAFQVETIGVAIGKDRTKRAENNAKELNVLLV